MDIDPQDKRMMKMVVASAMAHAVASTPMVGEQVRLGQDDRDAAKYVDRIATFAGDLAEKLVDRFVP